MTALARAGLAMAATLGLGAPATGAPPCLATAGFDPAEAVVGQQVLYRIEIASSELVDEIEWRRPPAFPGFRAERLPGRPQPGPLERDGATYRVREEERALFPERAGELAVGGAVLHCKASNVSGARDFEVELPTAVLRVLPHSEGGTGLVGPLAVRARALPTELALGGSLRLEVTLSGSGNLWDAPDPLEGHEIPDTEVFAHRPELRLEPGTRLLVRRTFSYDLVPHREGPLRVPPVRVTYLDPETRRHAEVRTEAVTVRVSARPPPAAPSRGSARATEPSDGAPLPRALPIALAALLVAALAARFAVSLRRRARHRIASDATLASAAAARESGDAEREAAALARALRDALILHLPAARDRAAHEIADDAPSAGAVASAARLLAALDRSRFDPAASPPDRGEVERAVRELTRTASVNRPGG